MGTTAVYGWPYPDLTDPPDGPAQIQALAEDVEATLAGLGTAWSTYVPVWSAGTTAPVPGNATLTGAYRRVGMTCDVRITLIMGSTTTYGTGTYRLTLPAKPKINSLIPAWAEDNNLSQRWGGVARIIGESATGDNMRIVIADATGGVTHGAPFTWAQSDTLILSGTYEVAP